MLQVTKLRAVNGRSRKRFGKKPAPAKRRPRNPAYLLEVGPLNPQRRTPTMKKGKKHKAPRKKNPASLFKFKRQARKSHCRRRRNPTPLLSRPINMLKTGAYALAGLVITRQAPQMLLGERNTGVWGYVANFITALGTGAVVGRIAGKEAGAAAGIGGSLYLANRILSENFSPIPKALALSGRLGDAAAVGSLGAAVPAYFLHPPTYDPATGRPYIPSEIRAAAREEAQSVMRTAASTMGRRAA